MLTPTILIHYPGAVEPYTEAIGNKYGLSVFQGDEDKDLETQLNLCTKDLFVISLFEPFLNNVIYKGFKTIAVIDAPEKIHALYAFDLQDHAVQWNERLEAYLTETGIKDLATVVIVKDNNQKALSWADIKNILAF